MTFFKKKQTRGFTLIEILVVIAIIGLLASIVLVSLNIARARARDAARKLDMRQLQTALTMYFNDNNAYPTIGFKWRGSSSCSPLPSPEPSPGRRGIGPGPILCGHKTDYIPGLVPNYMSVLPLDPTDTPNGFVYGSFDSGKNYKLLSSLSPESYPSKGEPFYDPVRPGTAWMVCSGEPACSTW